MAFTNEQIQFRVIQFPCCHHTKCWVSNRLPNFCPECGKAVHAQLKANPERYILLDTKEAWLRYPALYEKSIASGA